MTRAIHWPAPAASKYHAQRATLDGERFDSRRESARYAELQLLLRAAQIRDLARQVAFPLHACVAGVDGQCSPVVVARYIADFVYDEATAAGWQRVIEDAKGVRTPVYRLKRKWFEAQYRVPIREV